MIWAIIIILGFILDRVSKVWAIDALADNPITVIDNFFYFRYLENRGAAFSILQGKMVFLIIMTSIVSLAVLFVIFKYKDKFLRTTLSLILSGALGNLYDRITKGSVTDFIDFNFGSYVFPTFNVADMLVVVGTILLAIYILFIYKEDKPVEQQSPEPKKEEKND
jgi:signal peptidase II